MMLFLQPHRLPLTQKLASWCSVAMIVIMLPLFVTSFPSVRRKMDGRRWKKLQRLAYLFYALLCAHILLLTIPYAISARPGYRLTVFVYTTVFASYAVCRVQKALPKDKRAFRPHAGVVLGAFAASIVLAFTCVSAAPQAAQADAAAPVENAAPAPSAEAEASGIGSGTPAAEAIAAQPENAEQGGIAPEEAAAVADAPSEEPSAGESDASEEPESPPRSEPSPAIEAQSEPVPRQQETPSVSEPEPEPQPAVEPDPVSVYRDGTYMGTGMGFEGPITVSVTVQNDRIVSVQVLSQSEDEPFWTDALAILSRIVSAQSPDVDAVSEATSSCHGIMDAVRQALEDAKR
ncbi:MAG: FMN-binding protein [Oscillospiraceae bacterium]|nr:FMN-binding protein [Oscillospiraceae bacterium]